MIADTMIGSIGSTGTTGIFVVIFVNETCRRIL